MNIWDTFAVSRRSFHFLVMTALRSGAVPVRFVVEERTLTLAPVLPQHGATLCLTTPSSLYSSLADSILALECTLVDLTPTIGALLFEHDEAQPREGESVRDAWRRAGFKVKQVNTGGEKVEKAVRDKWRERGVRVCIDYGPTCVPPPSFSVLLTGRPRS